MNFDIKQLNFLYVYKYCKENHLNVSAYDEVSIEQVDKEDIANILKFLLFKENILISFQEITFSQKVEKYISQPDVVNLAEVGTVLNKNIQTISKFKSDLKGIIDKAEDRDFIEGFDVLIEKKREIKDILSILNNIDDSTKKNKGSNENKKRAANFLFS